MFDWQNFVNHPAISRATFLRYQKTELVGCGNVKENKNPGFDKIF